MKTQESTQQHGEAALLAQIAELQKQLADCLGKKPSAAAPIKTLEIESTLEMACAAPFMPKWKGKKGEQTFTPKYVQWRYLQENLIDSEALSHYWSHKLFKEVLLAVNYITNKMAMQKPNHQTPEKYAEPAEELGSHFCYCDQDEHEALILLKEIVEFIKESEDIYNPDIDDILVSVSLIIACQAIYLSCQDEPEPEEEEEKSESEPSA
jgi:hypothetical protein